MIFSDHQVITDLSTGIVQVRLTAYNPSDTVQNAVAAVDVCLMDDPEPLIEPFESDVTVLPGAFVTFEIMTAVYYPHIWTPDDPFLYRVKISTREMTDSPEGIVTEKIIASGFREFSADAEGIFRLNGKRIPIRPVSSVSGEHSREWAERAKQEGYNIVRTDLADINDDLLDYYDRTGMMVCIGSGIDHSKSFADGRLKSYRNHPSVIIWDLFDDIRSGSDEEKILDSIRKFDASRMVILRKGTSPDQLPAFARQCNPYVGIWQRNWNADDEPESSKFDFELIFEGV